MKKQKTILATSDLSDNAEMAIERAAQLASQHGAKLEILHVLEDWPDQEPAGLPLSLPLKSLLRKAAEAARERLQRQTERAIGDAPPPELRVEVGKDFVVIIRRARQIEADLIVVGAHGSHFVRDLFLGTTAEKVVRKGDRPVLVVKKASGTPYRRVLIPTDFSDASRQAFLAALDIAPGARFDLLHVYRLWGAGRLGLAAAGDRELTKYHAQLQETAEIQMTEFLKDLDPASRRLTRHLLQGHPPTLIPAQATELGSDLVAVGTEGVSGLPYHLLGSVTEHVMRHAACDVLAVRPSSFCFRLP